MVKKWREKEESDSANVDYIKLNCKICPHCQTPIEKNQGCNHMTCKNCKGEFCWLCGGPYRGHTRCVTQEELKGAAISKSELARYTDHFERYINHKKAGEFAMK